MVSADRRSQMANSGRSSLRDPIASWLWMVAGLVVTMIIVGGFVRLSRAGLSIVTWDPVKGVIPPIGDAAWRDEFLRYQQTPEYLLVNTGMSLAEFQRIFMIEWAHRLIGRIAGLMVVVPLIWFMVRGIVTVRESLRYWGVAALFGIQGVLGWVMVSSGLQDRPIVSHTRLAIHLIVALAVLALVMWMALDRTDTRRDRSQEQSRGSVWWLSVSFLGAVSAQIAVGGIVAGLRAGTVSTTWPLMAGRWVPQGLLTDHDPWWLNFIEPVGAHWLHRWLAFGVAALAVSLFIVVRRGRVPRSGMRVLTAWAIGFVGFQIFLGISVVALATPKWLALAHQANGVAVFCVAVVMCHTARIVRHGKVSPAQVH